MLPVLHFFFQNMLKIMLVFMKVRLKKETQKTVQNYILFIVNKAWYFLYLELYMVMSALTLALKKCKPHLNVYIENAVYK